MSHFGHGLKQYQYHYNSRSPLQLMEQNAATRSRNFNNNNINNNKSSNNTNNGNNGNNRNNDSNNNSGNSGQGGSASGSNNWFPDGNPRASPSNYNDNHNAYDASSAPVIISDCMPMLERDHDLKHEVIDLCDKPKLYTQKELNEYMSNCQSGQHATSKRIDKSGASNNYGARNNYGNNSNSMTVPNINAHYLQLLIKNKQITVTGGTRFLMACDNSSAQVAKLLNNEKFREDAMFLIYGRWMCCENTQQVKAIADEYQVNECQARGILFENLGIPSMSETLKYKAGGLLYAWDIKASNTWFVHLLWKYKTKQGVVDKYGKQSDGNNNNMSNNNNNNNNDNNNNNNNNNSSSSNDNVNKNENDNSSSFNKSNDFEAWLCLCYCDRLLNMESIGQKCVSNFLKLLKPNGWHIQLFLYEIGREEDLLSAHISLSNPSEYNATVMDQAMGYIHNQAFKNQNQHSVDLLLSSNANIYFLRSDQDKEIMARAFLFCCNGNVEVAEKCLLGCKGLPMKWIEESIKHFSLVLKNKKN